MKVVFWNLSNNEDSSGQVLIDPPVGGTSTGTLRGVLIVVVAIHLGRNRAAHVRGSLTGRWCRSGLVPGRDEVEQAGKAVIEIFGANSAATFEPILPLADESRLPECFEVVRQ